MYYQNNVAQLIAITKQKGTGILTKFSAVARAVNAITKPIALLFIAATLTCQSTFKIFDDWLTYNISKFTAFLAKNLREIDADGETNITITC